MSFFVLSTALSVDSLSIHLIAINSCVSSIAGKPLSLCVCVLVVRFAWLHIISVFHYYTYCYINCFELGLEAGKMEEPQKHHPARGV